MLPSQTDTMFRVKIEAAAAAAATAALSGFELLWTLFIQSLSSGFEVSVSLQDHMSL